MEIIKYVLQGILVLGGLFLTLFILMHKGQGGGMSDMFGGSMSATMGGSTVAERNLNRITVVVALVWFLSIIGMGLLDRFADLF